jgi:hypothetical protein
VKRAFISFAIIALVSAMAAVARAQISNGFTQGGLPNLPAPSPVAGFDTGYLDHHPEVARELSRNPALADNPQFLATHPGLDSYLASHPQIRTDLQQHPERFMNAEGNYERAENRRSYEGAVSRFDEGYLDKHPEVARELSHNPALADNPQFLASHPGLGSYLANHPKVRADLQQHPYRFMSAESRYERYENGEHGHGRWRPHPLNNGGQGNGR